jgi:O-antigen ligase
MKIRVNLMSLYNFSPIQNETTFTKYVSHFWNNMTRALATLPVWERGLHIFWLLGPFILLIERSPADVWLTILAITFAVRAIIKRDVDWLRVFWVKAAFLFWGVCLFSAAISATPSYALSEAFIWFRFPMFAMATAFWLGTDKRLLYAMLVSTAIGIFVMTGILTAEMLIEGQKGGRLTWPYDDLVPGNYLSKVGLPVFTVMVALAVGAKPRLASAMGLLSIATVIMSVLTGERINFLIRACAGLLAALVWKPFWNRYLILIVVEILSIMAVFMAFPEMVTRYLDTTINDIPTGIHSDYYRVMGGGVVAFLEAPIFGIGTANYRDLCPDIMVGLDDFRCDNHPHNFYIQLLAETGIVGFFAGVTMICSFIFITIKAGLQNRKNVVAVTAFIAPLGFFFPIASTADFFGQWNNIFMWSALALSLASTNLKEGKIC